MSFRRIPFKFSSTDPLERQAELQKRFGLSSASDNMFVDMRNPVLPGTANKDSDTFSSPRLQHRIPIFMQGEKQHVKSSVDSVSSNSDSNRKPNVRVIPIEIEGADCQPSTRHRTFSGPAGWAKEKEQHEPIKDDGSLLKRSMQNISHPTKVKVATGSKVHNIPIQVEGRNNSFKSPKLEKVIKTSNSKKDHPQENGCMLPKSSNKSPEKQQNAEQEQATDADIEDSLKKIASVLEELKAYELGVKEFMGTVKDKRYRYIDEMLTRCMLRLDDIDTMGNEEVRSVRKNAVKKVQACIDHLETKVNIVNEDAGQTINSEVKDESELSKNVDMEEDSEVCNESSKNASEDQISAADTIEITDSQCELPENIEDISKENDVNEVVMTESKTPVNDTTVIDSEIEMTEDRNHISSEDTDIVPEVDTPDKLLMEKAEKEVSENHDPSCSLTENKVSDVKIEDIQESSIDKQYIDLEVGKSVTSSSLDKENAIVSELPAENGCLEVSNENHNSTDL